MRKKLFPSAMLLCAALLIGCGGSNTYSPDVQGGGGNPSFALTVTPASQTVLNGGSTTYTVTATSSNGFSTPINLSITGVPTGGTGTFAPASITPAPGGANSTLTINTAGGTGSVAGTIRSPHRGRDVDPGAYTLTIIAMGGGITQQRQVQLTVQANGGGGGNQ
jgi:hypothetical protein